MCLYIYTYTHMDPDMGMDMDTAQTFMNLHMPENLKHLRKI